MKRTVVKRAGLKPGRAPSAAKAAPPRWDLTDLLKAPAEQFDAFSRELDGLVARFEACRSELSADMAAERFLDVMRLGEHIAEISTRLSAYAYLWFAESTKDQVARAFKNRVEERLTGLQNRMLFFELWWQSVDAANADRLLAASGDLRYHLETIRRFTPHTLSEPEEKIVNL